MPIRTPFSSAYYRVSAQNRFRKNEKAQQNMANNFTNAPPVNETLGMDETNTPFNQNGFWFFVCLC